MWMMAPAGAGTAARATAAANTASAARRWSTDMPTSNEGRRAPAEPTVHPRSAAREGGRLLGARARRDGRRHRQRVPSALQRGHLERDVGLAQRARRDGLVVDLERDAGRAG